MVTRYRITQKQAAYKGGEPYVSVLPLDAISDSMMDLGDFVRSAEVGDTFTIEIVSDAVALSEE